MSTRSLTAEECPKPISMAFEPLPYSVRFGLIRVFTYAPRVVALVLPQGRRTCR